MLVYLDHHELLRAISWCKHFQQVVARFSTELWGSLLRQPKIEPYYDPSETVSMASFQMAAALSNNWRDGTSYADRDNLKMLVFESYVRCVRCDFQTKEVIVGLYNGVVQKSSWFGPAPGRTERSNTRLYQPEDAFQSPHSGQVLAIDFDNDVNVCVSGSGAPSYHHQRDPGATVKLHEISSGKCFATLVDHTDSVNAVELIVSDADLFAVSGSSDASLISWRLNGTGTPERAHTMRGHEAAVTCLSLSKRPTKKPSPMQLQTSAGSIITKEDRWLLSGSHDATIRVWDWTVGECLQVLHDGGNPISCIHHYPPGGTIAIGRTTDRSDFFNRY